MNRILRGGVALAAAAVLCAGAAPSLAWWQAQAEADSATTFTMGTLELTAEPGMWLLDGGVLTEDVRAVPGSTLTYTQEFTITLDGDDLVARITVDPGAVSRADALLLGEVTLSAPAVPDGEGWILTEGGVVTLTLPFTWPKGSAVDDAAQGAHFDIAPTELLIVQELPA